MPISAAPTQIRPTEALAGVLERTDQKETALISDMAKHYLHELSALAMQPPASVARAVHRAVDVAIADQFKRDRKSRGVQCKSGCSHCCHIPAHITAGEAELMVGQYPGKADARRLELQAGLTDAEYMALPKPDRACVFLKDNRCGVYRDRPSVCRKHFVVSDPAQCNTVRFPGGKVLQFVAIEAEVAASAAGTIFPLKLLATAVKAAQT